MRVDKVRYYEENEEGVKIMCKVFEDIKNEARKEKSKEIARKMLKRGKKSVEEISEDTGLSIDEILALKGTFSA